ncbi:unnamed protein product [Effrenium voratum]|nr:unnamed protein product [Effrenium voratum]
MLYFRRPRCRSPFFVTERAESLARGTPPQFAARRCHGQRHSAARRGQGPGAREEAGGVSGERGEQPADLPALHGVLQRDAQLERSPLPAGSFGSLHLEAYACRPAQQRPRV